VNRKKKVLAEKLESEFLWREQGRKNRGKDVPKRRIAGGRIFFGYFDVSACLAVKVWL
jgi:hypothetical protein